jgi:hypothetical protein
LTIFSKIIEKLIYARLILHIEDNNILVSEQYGFRAHSSTEKAAYTLIDKILMSLNYKHTVFCDLQKAFDCVDHIILMNKLQFYGIDGKFKTLIKTYLTGRQQKVVLGSKSTEEHTSKWEIIKSGVPQGSILGPLSFLLYINDLPKVSNRDNNIVLYAEDMSIIITDTNTHNFKRNRNRIFREISTRFKANLLILNFQKTQYIEFRTKTRAA